MTNKQNEQITMSKSDYNKLCDLAYFNYDRVREQHAQMIFHDLHKLVTELHRTRHSNNKRVLTKTAQDVLLAQIERLGKKYEVYDITKWRK